MIGISSVKITQRKTGEVIVLQNNAGEQNMEVKFEGEKLIVKRDDGLSTKVEFVFPLQNVAVVEVEIGD